MVLAESEEDETHDQTTPNGLIINISIYKYKKQL
jgi:hypothetical protein